MSETDLSDRKKDLLALTAHHDNAIAPRVRTLRQAVQRIVPEARLEPFELPVTLGKPSPGQSQIQLYLINRDFHRGPLPQEAALKLMDEPFYWAFCWASGLVMANYIAAHPESVRNKCVVDFGCGSGVVAIAAAKAGAARVVACDNDPLALTATRANAELNEVLLELSKDFNDIDGGVEMVTAADVLYERENLPWLDRFLTRSPQVLLADSRIQNFSHAGYKHIGVYDSCTLPDLDESQEFRRVNLYWGKADFR